MTRDADIARIAAMLDPAMQGGYVAEMPTDIIAAALYDAGLRPSVEPASTVPFADRIVCGAVTPDGRFACARRRNHEGQHTDADNLDDDEWLSLTPSVEPAGLREAVREFFDAEAAYLRHVSTKEPVPYPAPPDTPPPDFGPWDRMQEAKARLGSLIGYAALPTQASDSPEKP